MAAVVARSHDILRNPLFTSKPSPKSRRRTRRRSPDASAYSSTPPLVMGQVRILKRGEDPVRQTDVFSSPDPIGPEPGFVPIKVGIVDLKPEFAGSVYMCSPSPRAVPMPTFSLLRKAEEGNLVATKGLRCLLHLDFE